MPLSNTVEKAVGRFRPLLSEKAFAQLLEMLDSELLPAIRINTLKHEPTQFITQLQQSYGWEFDAVPFCPSGFNLAQPADTLSKSIEHALGDYYIQESASMLSAEMFDFANNPHPLILDMAASPGGKTTHIVDRTRDQAVVIANDASASRMQALRVVLAKWGAINQALTCLHGEYFGEQLPETFDAVLLDAPCSMQNLYDTPSHPLRQITPGEQQSLSNRQFLLLRSALQTVKVSGQVVYSTCTLSPEEDEQVVERILQEFGNCLELDDLTHKLPKPAPGLLQDGQQYFDPRMQNVIRLWPHIYGTTGFFCARFTKKDSMPSESNTIKSNIRQRKAKGQYLPKKQTYQICDWMMEQYGFDLEEVLHQQKLAFLDTGRDIYLVPARLEQRFPALPIMTMGLNALKPIPDGYQISHEFAARFGGQFQLGIIPLDEKYVDSFLQRKDIFEMKFAGEDTGKTLLVKDTSGRVLGRAKALKDRLKNLLPPRLL